MGGAGSISDDIARRTIRAPPWMLAAANSSGELSRVFVGCERFGIPVLPKARSPDRGGGSLSGHHDASNRFSMTSLGSLSEA
jgi:hypothetical protein